MKQPDCASVVCIYNDKLKKGMCIGVSQNTNSYGKDVVRQCWVKEKPTPNMKCITEMQAQMTPMEADTVALGLAHASAYGQLLLNKIPVEIKPLEIPKKEGTKAEKETNTS